MSHPQLPDPDSKPAGSEDPGRGHTLSCTWSQPLGPSPHLYQMGHWCLVELWKQEKGTGFLLSGTGFLLEVTMSQPLV